MNFGQKILYYLLLGTFKIIGSLPYAVLYYFFAEIIYFVLHRLLRYRIKVVRVNLSSSFPEKSKDELRAIEKKFYHHISEVFIDTMAICAMSAETIKKRFVYEGYEEMERIVAGKTWICAMAHYGSWEYTINYKLFTDHTVAAVYKPLHNKVMEAFYMHMRSRFGTVPVSMYEVGKVILKNYRAKGNPMVIALIGDQTPREHSIHHWYPFLNQLTPFHMGAEKLSEKFHLPVYYMRVRKVKRGYYRASFDYIYDGEETLDEMEITARYVRLLEDTIRETPELWLWSHRRWKHKPREGHTYKYYGDA